jgi:histidyl-tRNA synthetase
VELAGETSAGQMLEFVSSLDSDRETLRRVGSLLPADCPPIQRLDALWRCIEACGLREFFHFDPAITRGLDYYTGVVFETFLGDLPDIGSVCSGGRYNDLASLYTREKLPGVGASIGLDRLMAALQELGLAAGAAGAPDALVLLLDEALLPAYHRLASALRAAGLAAEVYPEARKLAAQLKYAEKRAIPLAVIFGSQEQASGLYTLKDLRNRRSHEGLTAEALAETAARLLRS